MTQFQPPPGYRLPTLDNLRRGFPATMGNRFALIRVRFENGSAPGVILPGGRLILWGCFAPKVVEGR
jgi:hypothetical protein